jgi:hypothetical protein
MMKLFSPFLFLAVFYCCVPAQAQQKPVAGLGIKLGDDLSTVKKVFKLDYEPEKTAPVQSRRGPPTDDGRSIYKIRTKGIWIIFSPAQKVELIRLEAPFNTPIAGISLGDSFGKVLSTHGKPLPKSNMFAPGIYLYPLDDKAYVSFEIEDSEVRMISIRP